MDTIFRSAAAANSPTGLLTVVFKAVEDGTGYKGDWGDQERSTPAKLNLSIGVGSLVPDPGTLLFFESPSPGLPNLDGVTGFLADTTFSVDRGFYETSFTTDIN